MKRILKALICFILCIFLIGCNSSNKGFKVTFIVDNEIYLEETYEKDSLINKPTDPTKDKCQFIGWFIDDEQWIFHLGKVTSDITLTAKFDLVSIIPGITPVFKGMEAIDPVVNTVKTKLKKNIINQIEDVVLPTIDVIPTEGVGFFTDTFKEYLIVIHLYNPSYYEILSVTINGKKFQSFEFQDGSDSLNIILKMPMETTPGIKTIEVDSIKYVDKTEIKDVEMEADRIIRVGIKYDYLPLLTLDNENITTSSYDTTFNLTDKENLINKDNLMFYLSDGNKIIKTLKLDKDNISINLSNLKSNETYQYLIIGIYDNLDGMGKKANILYKKTFTTLSGFIINNEVITEDKINFDIINKDSSFKFNSISLVKDGEVINYSKTLVTTYTNLLSNNDYEIIIKYTKDNEELAYSYHFKTLTKAIPSVDIITKAKIDGFTFDLYLTDNDKIATLKSIKLYKDEKLIDTLTDLNIRGFSNLLSDVTYTLEVIYEYDLNDGLGKNELVKRIDVSTFRKAPTLDVELIVFDNHIDYKVKVKDVNNVGKFSKVYLYSNSNLINSFNALDGTINNLEGNKKYSLKVVYTYDLLDGEGERELVKSVDFQTKKDAPVLNIASSSTTNSISYKINYDNRGNDVKYEAVKLYKDGILIDSLNKMEGEFSNLLAGNNYEILIKYSYLINDQGDIEISSLNKTIKTKSYQAPIIGVNLDELSNEVIKGEVVVLDNDKIFNLINVSFYKNDVLIDTSNSLLFDYKVDANVLYKIVVNYSYNLFDGNGIQTTSFEYVITSKKTVPQIYFTPYIINTDSIQYNLLISDNNVTGRVNLIGLYENNKLIKKLDEFTTELTNLSANTLYKIKVNYIYDFDDGYGSRELVKEFTFKTLKNTPTINIDLLNVTNNSFKVNPVINDIDESLRFKEVKVYRDNGFVASRNSLYDLEFLNLLSDTEYKVVISYMCDLNLGEEEISSTIFVKTLPLTKPTININTTCTRSSIIYDYEINDPDNISKLLDIKLFKGSNLIASNPLNNSFTNLLSNNDYTLRIALENDYHNAKKPVIEYYYKEVTTDFYYVPFVHLTVESDKNTISGVADIHDETHVIKSYSLKLYLNGKEVDEFKGGKNYVFSNLLSNTVYDVVASYTYDLHDGIGLQTFEDKITYSTLAYDVNVTDYKILNEHSPMTNDDILVCVYLDNKSNIKVEYLIVNGKKTTIIGGNNTTNVVFKVKANKQSGMQIINLEKFAYYVNQIEMVQNVNLSKPLEVMVFSRLDIISIDTPNYSNLIRFTDHGLILTIDNPNGYTIKKVYICNSEWLYDAIGYEVVQIDNNHIYILNDGYFLGYNYVAKLDYIDNDGNFCSREMNQRFYLDISHVEHNPEDYTIKNNVINSVEDFFNIKSNNSYILGCDLDFSGYKWKRIKFNGIIDGRGHKLSNIAHVIQTEVYPRTLGLFEDDPYSGLVKEGIINNVFFENIYINYNVTPTPGNVQTYSKYEFHILSDHIKSRNLLFSGNIRLGGKYDIILPTDNVYGIGTFKINNNEYYGMNRIGIDKLDNKEFIEDVMGWKFKEKDTFEKDGFVYSLYDNSYVIIEGYKGMDKDLIIPSVLNGYPVIGIEDKAFENNLNLTGIEIRKNILYLGAGIIKGCNNITKIKIDAKTTALINLKDSNYGNISYLISNNSIIQNNIKYLDIRYALNEWVMSDMENLVEYIVPNGIDNMSTSFKNLINLKKVILSDTVKTISGSVFYECKSLEEVVFNEGLETIGSYAFYNCPSLNNIDFPSTLKEIDQFAFSANTSLENIHFPQSLNVIENNAFEYCTSLKSVVLPDNMLKIWHHTFSYCESISNLHLPANLISIGGGAFDNCRSLTELVIPKKTTKIESYAFQECTSLKSIYLPLSVTFIDECAFKIVDGPTNVYYEGTKEQYQKIEILKCNDILGINRNIFYSSYN